MENKSVSKFIFVLNGSNESGKDTFVDLIKEMESQLKIKCFHISSVDVIKNMAKKYGWDGVKNEKGRTLLHDLKEAWDKYNSMTQQDIFRKTKNWIEKSDSLSSNFLFVDIREPEKIEAYINSIEKYYGDVVCVGSILIRSSRSVAASNPADQGVTNFNYDLTITNNGTIDDLKGKAETFVKSLIYYR